MIFCLTVLESVIKLRIGVRRVVPRCDSASKINVSKPTLDPNASSLVT